MTDRRYELHDKIAERDAVLREFGQGFRHSCELCSMTSCSTDEERLDYVSKRMAEEIVRLRNEEKLALKPPDKKLAAIQAILDIG